MGGGGDVDDGRGREGGRISCMPCINKNGYETAVPLYINMLPQRLRRVWIKRERRVERG